MTCIENVCVYKVIILDRFIKNQSDEIMEQTWDNDIQSKICYIYDFYHDDQPRLAEGMTYENTTKTRIDAKFIVKSYQSMDKDQVDYYVQFRPSQSIRFSEDDELYYFETDYKTTYGNTFPIGLYLDIPDDRNVYHKWLICREEKANQFPKYLVLPCDYELCWIEVNGKDRIKRRMWSVLRMQSSYTIGQYTDRVFTRTDNQNKIWLPLNKYTEKFWYTTNEDTTMRIVVSAPTEHPLIWACTKIENIQPVGIQKLTIYQTVWSDNRDYIEKRRKWSYCWYVGFIFRFRNRPNGSIHSNYSPIFYHSENFSIHFNNQSWWFIQISYCKSLQ